MNLEQLKPKVTVNNFLKLSLFNSDIGGRVRDEHRVGFAIDSDESFNLVLEFLNKLYEMNSNVKKKIPDNIEKFNYIVNNVSTEEVDSQIIISYVGTMHAEEIVLYSPEFKDINEVLINDMKCIMIEDYIMFKASRNIVFRFNLDDDYFYLRLNSELITIRPDYIDGTRLIFEFSTIIKNNKNFNFESVRSITSVDSSRINRSFILEEVELDMKNINEENDLSNFQFIGKLK